ncbi:MAG: alpha/beta hydrolase fold domain-containing protein [Ilumatobacteraceae bacterium]
MPTSRRARIARRSVAKTASGPEMTTAASRKRMDQLDRLPRPRKVDYVDTTVGGIPAIVATPTAVEPVRHILYIHGGAYVTGSPKSHIAMVANLAKRASATATVIDYRLAPEHVHPAAIDDCVAAYRALVADIDPALVTIAGDSAGGGAALATACALRDAGDPLPGALYLMSPWTDLTGSGESVTTRQEFDPMLDGSRLVDAGLLYAGDTPLDDPGVSPLFADLAGLPPMLVQTGMDEILLSDSTRLADAARDAGVDVTLDLADGMWHVYQAFARFMPEADDALIRAAVFIRGLTPALMVP